MNALEIISKMKQEQVDLPITELAEVPDNDEPGSLYLWSDRFGVDKSTGAVLIPQKEVYTSKDIKKFFTLIGNKQYDTRWVSFHWQMCGLLEEYDDNIGKVSRQETTFVRRFFRYEHLIKNDELFWGLCYPIWFYGGSTDQTWEKVFSRYGRLKVPLAERIRLFSAPRLEKDDDRPAERYFIGKKLDQYKDDDYLPIYRGFNVREGKSVRKGAKKIGNPDSMEQDEGRGFAYSLSKIYASAIPYGVFNPYFFEKYGGITDKKIVREMLEKSLSGYTSVRGQAANVPYYTAVGFYGVKKKHIIAITLQSDEEEVVCLPKHAKLLDYEFLTLSKCLSAHFLWRIARGTKHITKNSEQDAPLMMHTSNEKQLLKDVDTYYRKFYHQPEDMQDIFSGSNERNLFSRIGFEKAYEGIEGKSFGQDIYQSTDGKFNFQSLCLFSPEEGKQLGVKGDDPTAGVGGAI